MQIIDIHPHIISDDTARYPLAPLFGKRSEWSKDRGHSNTAEAMIAAMDDAGVAKAAVVHSSTTYGFDNSYVVDGCNRYPERLVAVGSVDMLDDNVADVIKGWAGKGVKGLRIFTGGSTKDFDPTDLENPKSFKAWEVLSELGIPMCIQTGPIGLPQVTMLAKRFPSVNIILDHLARPEVQDGPPYRNAAAMYALSDLPNIYLKVTPRIFREVKTGKASAETFFPQLVESFGARRLAWGSNFPASNGSLSTILADARAGLACLSEDDQSWILGKTAQELYPALA